VNQDFSVGLLGLSFDGFVIAATNSFLLLGAEKWTLRTTALKVLCGKNYEFPLFGQVLTYIQSAFSLLLFFLIGLAFRNRFRMSGSSGG